MANAKISEARLRLIMKRQWAQAWGSDYIPSQWATPAEAPGLSTATIMRPRKLGGRAFHTLSQNETWVALLALFHPDVWDIHEQRVLYPQPTPHFLQGHPSCQGLKFDGFQGTLAVAERMGVLNRHPKCRIRTPEGEFIYAPFPYLGDLLVFVEDEDGPYALNLTIKDKLESFRRRGPKPGRPDLKKDDLNVINRHQLELNYYQDAGISTRQVVGKDIDLELRSNLQYLFQFHSESTNIPEAVQKKLWDFFQSEVGTSKTAHSLVKSVAEQMLLDPLKVRTVLLQAIWNRRVKVDLFRPVLMDRALRPMLEDPVDVYKSWFIRG
jgi:hypothetical protein